MDIDPKCYAKQTQEFLKANKLDILDKLANWSELNREALQLLKKKQK